MIQNEAMKGFLPNELMQKIMLHSPIACVDVMFLNPDKTRTLLFKRNNKPAKDKFFAMGGRIWKGEKFTETASRKAIEELGITIDTDKLIGPLVSEEIWPDSEFSDTPYHAVAIFFAYVLSEEAETLLQCDAQHSGGKWFELNDPSLDPLIMKRIHMLTGLLKCLSVSAE